MNPALRGSAAHVFVESLAAPALDERDHHHLVRVLRLRAGEVVSVSDGAGAWRLCRLAAAGGLEPDGEVIAEVAAARGPLTVGFAMPKGDRPEWITQKLTEIGIDRIVLLATERGVVRWDADKAARHRDKLGVVAREAAMQSRRVTLPQIEGPVPVAEAVQREAGVALAEPGGDTGGAGLGTILIGPEGGWTEGELALAPRTVELGSTILRVETAALLAAAVLVRERGS